MVGNSGVAGHFAKKSDGWARLILVDPDCRSGREIDDRSAALGRALRVFLCPARTEFQG